MGLSNSKNLDIIRKQQSSIEEYYIKYTALEERLKELQQDELRLLANDTRKQYCILYKSEKDKVLFGLFENNIWNPSDSIIFLKSDGMKGEYFSKFEKIKNSI